MVRLQPFMVRRPHWAHLLKISLHNRSPWSSHWSPGIKAQRGQGNLSLGPCTRRSCRAVGGLRIACRPGWPLMLAASPGSHECFSARFRPCIQVLAKQVVTDICLQQRPGPRKHAARARIVSGGSWGRQNSFGLPLEAWRPETPKVGAGWTQLHFQTCLGHKRRDLMQSDSAAVGRRGPRATSETTWCCSICLQVSREWRGTAGPDRNLHINSLREALDSFEDPPSKVPESAADVGLVFKASVLCFCK